MKVLEYIAPDLYLVNVKVSRIICLSDPTGNTTNEGFTEEDFEW